MVILDSIAVAVDEAISGIPDSCPVSLSTFMATTVRATTVRATATRAPSLGAQSKRGAGRGGGHVVARALVATKAEVSRAVEEIECAIFDCDGVLWRGAKKIEGAKEAISSLEASGKRVFYLTNNSAKSRAQCALKLQNFGIEAEESQCVCSSSSAARYLDSIGYPKSQKVLVIGQEGIVLELEKSGYQVVTCSDLSSAQPSCSIEDYEQMEVDESIRAVVAGVDDTFSYRKLCIASLYLSTNGDLGPRVFVATNLDVGDRVGHDGRLIPGGGPVVAAIETACGRKPTNVGKGGQWLLPHLVETMALDVTKTCIVGDRLDTDIALGKEAGMLTILPLTGVTDEEDLEKCTTDMKPDLVVESIATLIPESS